MAKSNFNYNLQKKGWYLKYLLRFAFRDCLTRLKSKQSSKINWVAGSKSYWKIAEKRTYIFSTFRKRATFDNCLLSNVNVYEQIVDTILETRMAGTWRIDSVEDWHSRLRINSALWVKGVFSKPSGNLIVVPNFCFFE